MNDFSFDMETLSTRPNAALLSIGIVQFDRDTGKLGKELYLRIAMDDAIKHGHVLGSTLAWWMKQKDPGALSLFDEAQQPEEECPPMPAHGAVIRIRDFIESNGGGDRARVWGNGATADITWCESLFLSAGHGIEVPWKFWNIRDMRTTVDDANIPKTDLPAREGPHHHALYDARWQARVIAMCRQKLRGAKPLGPKARGARTSDGKAVRFEGLATERMFWHNETAELYFITEVGEALPVLASCKQLTEKEYMAALAPRKRWWHHAESDSYFVTQAGEELGDDIDAQCCREITQTEYDEATEL